jgi:hypothetical protein
MVDVRGLGERLVGVLEDLGVERVDDEAALEKKTVQELKGG